MNIKRLLISRYANFSWAFVGNAIYAVSQWGILIVIAKLGNPEMIGQFTIGLAIASPVYMLTNLQLSVVIATDAMDQYEFSHYIALRLLASLFGFFIIFLIVLFGKYSLETFLVIIFLSIAKGFETISDLIYGLLQKNERMDYVAFSLMLKGPLSFIALAGCLVLTRSMAGGALGMALTWLFLLLKFDRKIGSKFENLRPKFQKNQIASLIMLTIPLGVVMMISSLNANISRYFIQHYQGSVSLGYFAAISYTMTAGNTIVNALGQSSSPKLAKYYADGDKVSYLKLLKLLVTVGGVLGFLGTLVVLVFGKQILLILYDKEYVEYANIFIVIMIAAGISYVSSILGYSITAARYFKPQPYLSIVILIVSLILNALMVPKLGLMAAYATLGSSIIQLLGSVVLNLKVAQKLCTKPNFGEVKLNRE